MAMIATIVVASAALRCPIAGVALRSRAQLDTMRTTGCCMSESAPAKIQAATGRIVGSTVLGVAGGSAAHAAVARWSVLGTASFAAVSPLLNLLDLSLGGLCGAAVGFLWACEAALISSGAVRQFLSQAFGSVVAAKDDAMAGERALRTIREGLATASWPLRLAFFLTGLDQEPAVARLVNEAQAAPAQGANRSMSEIIALAFEATLEARLGDTKFLALALALLVGGAIDGAVVLAGTALGSVFGG